MILALCNRREFAYRGRNKEVEAGRRFPLGEACKPREGSYLHSLKAVINLIAKIVPKFTPQAQPFGKFPKK
jgi:hypothetical protein